MDAPFKTITGIADETLYEPKDIAFYGTEAFSEVGQYYLKHKIYTSLHPIYDKKKYDAFWDREELRRKEGMTLPCSLVKRADGSYTLQDLHITGEHYGYLNYAPIKRVAPETLAIEKMVKKTTTPTPSLNKDSPTILVSNFFGAPACFKIPKTAIGSVGDIKAPKSKQ